MPKLTFALFPLCSLILMACQKDKCGENYTFDVPSEVVEGETLVLAVGGYDNEINTYFTYECPDMTPYNVAPPGGESFAIQDFSIKDEGTYSVMVSPGGDGCQAFTMEKTVTMIPKTCPCAEPANINTLYYSPSYEGQFTEDPLTYSLFNSNSSGTSIITFNGQNTFKVFFGRELPEFSSTYTIVGGQNTYWDSSDDDYLDVHFHLNGYNHGFDFFRIADDDFMYATATPGQLTLEFCDIEVGQYYTGLDTFALSGKLVVDL